jgi:glutaryl-CoA dehydrogenase
MPTLDQTDLADFLNFRSFLTDEEHQRLNGLRLHLDEHVRPIADDYWERGVSPRHLLPGLAELGLFGAAFPEVREYENTALFRGWVSYEIARADASTSTLSGVHSGLAMTSIALGGSDEQRAKWLGPMARAEVIGAFGLTEPLSGSDTSGGLRTTARRDGDEWILDGAKRWIGNGTFADVVVIWARDITDDTVRGFLVPADTPGFQATKIQRKIALRAVENADISLEGVRVSEANRLQRIDGFRDVARVLRATRADVAWQALGNGAAAYEAAVAYTTTREQFGRPIASFQLVQSKLVTAAEHIAASVAVCTRIAQLQEAGTLRDEQSAMAKALVADRMRTTVALCRESLGGNGIQLDYGVARPFADAEAIYTYEGTNEMNSLIVGRAITGIPAFI